MFWARKSRQIYTFQQWKGDAIRANNKMPPMNDFHNKLHHIAQFILS